MEISELWGAWNAGGGATREDRASASAAAGSGCDFGMEAVAATQPLGRAVLRVPCDLCGLCCFPDRPLHAGHVGRLRRTSSANSGVIG